MLAVAVTLAAMGTAAALLLRRRRARRPDHGLSPALDPLPAGLKHLATEVSDLSHHGIHLAAGRSALAGRRRLGVLLGLR
jgi:hypothetical protein